ncbi:MAG TPA: tetratricopeptide repeat protein [Thermodesulfobacteriota bacterium]|nr:tetratricopeptide repeat protein [Thermodesulfobacteriota bacterium]
MLYFSKAIEINPEYVQAYANRGVAYGNEGMYDKAILDLNKAIELNPAYVDAYFNKALACEKTVRIGEALEAYKAFIQHAPPQYSRIIEHVKQRIRELEGR